MREFTADEVQQESATALESIRPWQNRDRYPAYVRLDVYKESIVVSVARAGRDAPLARGGIANKPQAVAKLVACLNREFAGEVLLFCYEARTVRVRIVSSAAGVGARCAGCGAVADSEKAR